MLITQNIKTLIAIDKMLLHNELNKEMSLLLLDSQYRGTHYGTHMITLLSDFLK